MATNTLHNRVLSYFENEIDSARKQLKAGLFESFKDQVIAGRKIAEALQFLTPYAEGDWRARRLVRSGEMLIKDLLSVRAVIHRRSLSPQIRQLLLIYQVITTGRYHH